MLLRQPRFLLYRKLRRISYKVKNATRGSHCSGTEFVASRPAAGGESCATGFYFFMSILCGFDYSLLTLTA